MKKYLYILTCLTFLGVKAQDGKIGIATQTPTEQLDIDNKDNGGLRVRKLPEEGDAINTTADGSNSEAKNTFDPVGFVVVDANGVLGVTPSIKDVDKDIRAYLFYEVKYKNIKDWMTAQSRNYLPFRVDEWEPFIFVNKMSTDETLTDARYNSSYWPMWSTDSYRGNFAIGIKSTADPVWVIKQAESPTGRRINNSLHRQQFDEHSCIIDNQLVVGQEQCIAEYGKVPAYWALWGDIGGISDSWDVTIIFVNKDFVATDAEGTVN